MAEYIEDFVPVVKYQGLSTNKAALFNKTYRSGAATALTAGSTVSVDPTIDNVFTLTPAQAETINAASAPAGQPLWLIVVTVGTSTYTLTFGTNFKTTGTLATGTSDAKTFVLQFISDGTNFIEVSRTTAI